MKLRIKTLGCDKEYGEKRTIMDDDQIGELTIHELEVDSLDDLLGLLDDADSLKIDDSPWDKYDANVTVICGKL